MKKISQKIYSLILALILVGGLSYALAWTNPTAVPTGGNVEAPINASSSSQIKYGPLVTYGFGSNGTGYFSTTTYSLPTSLTLGVNGSVGAHMYCDENGSNCIDPTALMCPEGQYMQGVDTDGTAKCLAPSMVYYFGGMYGGPSSAYTNPLAGNTKACPTNFIKYTMYGGWSKDPGFYLCVGTKTSGATKIADFGGMYGYGGNSSASTYTNPMAANTKACPTGYTAQQLLGRTDYDWNLFYCYKSNTVETTSGRDASFRGIYSSGSHTNPVTGLRTCEYAYTAKAIYGTTDMDDSVYVCY